MKKFAAFALCLLFQPLFLPAQIPDRSAPPPPGPPLPLRLPAVQSMKLSNGMPVLIVEKHDVPLVELRLMVEAGTAHDPDATPGLASMTASMLTEGAAGRSALELADEIDFLGASIGASAGYHTAVISLFTPLSKLEEALPLFADVVLQPDFPPQELERLRKDRLTSLRQWHDDARAVASIQFNAVLYGNSHPYGRLAGGTEKSLRAMKIENLREFYGKYYHAGGAVLIAAGDVTAASLVPKLQSLFGSWRSGPPVQASIPEAKQVSSRRITLVHKPGAAQSEIRIGRIGVPRLTEDYYALVVMNTILGGSFASRLNQNLREKHGYTYGARSSFSFRRSAGPFLAAAAVQTAVTDKAVAEFMKELRGMLEPVPEQELERAKNYIAYGYPGSFETAGQMAVELAQLAEFGLPYDLFNSFTERIRAVTREDVQRVARAYLDPERVEIVVVGDRKEIEYGLRALKLGKVRLLDVEDVLGKKPE